MADKLFKRQQAARKERISKKLEERSETWLIVCEGTETEPNYFERLIEYANSKSDKKVKYVIKGTGRNTETLVNCIDDFFNLTDKLIGERKIRYGKVFAVFDKDSFKKGQFNNAIFTAEKKDYIPIWSNECVELWFLLHFNLLESNVTRQEYFKKLGKRLNIKYNKADNHFDLLNSEVNLKNAYNNAKKLYKNNLDKPSYADKAPCTTIFKFIEDLEEYLGISLCS